MPITANDFRRTALAMTGAEEGSHFGQADFRVGGKIFATLSLETEGYGVLKLTPELQSTMIDRAPDVYSPVPKGWGRMGMTRIAFRTANKTELERALQIAWENRAPKWMLDFRGEAPSKPSAKRTKKATKKKPARRTTTSSSK